MCNGVPSSIRDRLQAWLVNEMDSAMHCAYGSRKQSLFAQHAVELVEIGPGAGANFRYYRPGTRITAIEPNVKMHARLRQRAAKYQLQLKIVAGGAESIPVPAESAGTIVGTLVLCSVNDVSRVLSEVHRVLRPGGRYIFLEHVAAKRRSIASVEQWLLHRVWGKLFAGCRVNQDTLSLIESSPFDSLAYEEFELAANTLPFSPHIAGTAVK